MPAPSMPVAIEMMTKIELMDLANEHGIEGLNARMLKADIIAAIKEAMNWT